MPEGDAIFRVARPLHRALGGLIITGFIRVLPILTRVDFDSGKWMRMHFFPAI
jgi:hypothetical protein